MKKLLCFAAFLALSFTSVNAEVIGIVDFDKIRFWINEIIEPQKPKLMERVRYGR